MNVLKNKSILNSLFILVGVFVVMTIHQYPLTNERIVWMELCFSRSTIDAFMLQTKAYNVKQAFRTHVVYDFVMMLAYVNVLMRLLYMIDKRRVIRNRWLTRGLMFLLVLTGLLDASEDFLMYQYIIAGNWLGPWWMISAIKFLLLVVNIIYVASYLFSDYKKAHQ